MAIRWLSAACAVLVAVAVTAQEREVYNTPKALRKGAKKGSVPARPGAGATRPDRPLPAPPAVAGKATPKPAGPAANKDNAKPIKRARAEAPGARVGIPSLPKAPAPRPVASPGGESIEHLSRIFGAAGRARAKDRNKPGVEKPTPPASAAAPRTSVGPTPPPPAVPTPARPTASGTHPAKSAKPSPATRPTPTQPVPTHPLAAPPPAGGRRQYYGEGEPPGVLPVTGERRTSPTPASPARPTVRAFVPESRPAVPGPPRPPARRSRRSAEKNGPAGRVASAAPGMVVSEAGQGKKDPGDARAAAELLHKVLEARGGYGRYLALKGLKCNVRITAFDESSSELFAYDARHDALVGREASDRVGLQEGLVMGRRGSAAWVEVDGLLRPDQKGRAVGELQVMGFLLRFPFVLGDTMRFRPVGTGRIKLAGKELLRLQVEEIRRRQRVVHTVLIEPETYLPRQLTYMGPDGRPVRVVLRGVRSFEGLDLPRRREILSVRGDGISLEFDLKEIEKGYFRKDHFLPRR